MKMFTFFLVMGFVCYCASAYAQDRTQRADSINQANARIIREDGQGFTKKATVAAKDSLIEIYARLGPGYKDYRIFGYAKPDTLSRRMIIISLFTDDVKDNPFDCPLGAYYDTDKMRMDSTLQLKYLGQEQNFVRAVILKNHKVQATVYFKKRWIMFEKSGH